ncbi:hypothetical protein OG563_38110 [Nocardia vinacea]|uniref:Sugar ABC transporter permease n=1 Tax=Nocardia vinacea TaxID=96468 RepID=A0ABZ1YPE6_9NOCA|nr:hypothetical protein [Nocardia vinacea]
MSEWSEAAMNSVLGYAGKTHAVVGERFPLYAERSGEWVTTSRGSWAGGFWAGLLWLRALHSGSAEDLSAAAQMTARLAEWVGADTATRGLIFWYGTALAGNTIDDDAELGTKAAQACLDDFDHELGVLPWGSAFGGPRLLARVDGVAGTVPLLAAASGIAMARAHLDTHLTRWRAEPVCTPAWVWTDGGWVAYRQPRPGWSRGRAWLLLALADACRHIDAGYLATAEELIDPTAPLIPAAELAPDAPLDTSAAAIEAVALLKLAAVHHVPEQAQSLEDRAIEILEQLVTRHLSASGALLDGCYDLDRELATAHELIWGDYFFALALAIHTGLVAPFDT